MADSITTQANLSASKASIRSKLQEVWGYSDFRSPQAEIIEALLQKRDAIAILPTGGGKSLCFQLPALMQTGVTLVISPLVALMENQVQDLHQRQLPAALLHSELPKNQYRQTLWALENQRLRLLYLSPETLLSPKVWQVLCQPQQSINGLILDEAHCLTQWGETFRPAYFRLGAVRRSLLQHQPPGMQIPIAAFTATADQSVQQTIQHILHLQQPYLVRLNPYRANLHLTVNIAWTPQQRKQKLLNFIRVRTGQSGLVYVRTRQDSEDLSTWLSQAGFQTAAYHAGLPAQERRTIEQGWLQGTLQFVVCTSAFGMGVNKENVRWIVHFQVPALLSEYIQEVGRAGRDGKPAEALALISEPTGWLDPSDKQRSQFFADQIRKHHQTVLELAPKLPTQGDVASVSKQFKQGAIALSLLHSMGCLEWTDPFHYVITQKPSLSKLSKAHTTAPQQMHRYLHTKSCRWQFLLNAFGTASEPQNFRCGHCDNCKP